MRTALFADAVRARAVPVLTEKTVYTRIGDLLPLVCLIVLGVLMGRLVSHDRYEALGALQDKMPGWIIRILNRMVDRGSRKQ